MIWHVDEKIFKDWSQSTLESVLRIPFSLSDVIPNVSFFKWFDKWPKLFNLFRLKSVGIWAIVLERKYIGNLGISPYLLDMCSEPFVMNLDITVLGFVSTKVKLTSLFYKSFDRYIDLWHRVFCFGHLWWDKTFYSLYKFDPHHHMSLTYVWLWSSERYVSLNWAMSF